MNKPPNTMTLRVEVVLNLGAETVQALKAAFATPDGLKHQLAVIETKLSSLFNQGDSMNAQIQAFKDTVDAALAETNTNVDNIAGDQVSQAKAIQDLKDQIANNPNSTLAPEDQAALDKVAADSQAMAVKTKAIADAVPENIPVPTV